MMDGPKDTPIEPVTFLSGVTVVDIGDVRVSRGLTRRHHSSCKHKRLIYDFKERRIWCSDCEQNIEPFDAFCNLVKYYSSALDDIKRRRIAVDEAERFAIRSIAAKRLDEAWRSRNMVPCCPHCRKGLAPEDFKHGPSMINKCYATIVGGKEPAP